MTKKRLTFNNIRLNEKTFHMSKKAINFMSVNLNKIVVSDKFNHNEELFKYFIGYQKDEIVKPLCIILPQMNGYIKYFEYGSPNMSFLIKDEEVGEKYKQIWDVIKKKVEVKFHSEPVYKYKYLKTKDDDSEYDSDRDSDSYSGSDSDDDPDDDSDGDSNK